MEQDTIITKECSHCHRTLLVTEFYKKKGTSDGLQYYCKQCQKEFNNASKRKKKTFRGGSRTHTFHATPAHRGAESPWLYRRT